MQSTRKSSRISSKCNQITNIFHPSHISTSLKQIIPIPILKKVQKPQQISCGVIQAFPTFEMMQESQEQLSSCIRAIQYQLNLQGQSVGPHHCMEDYSRSLMKQQNGIYSRDHVDVATKDLLDDEKEKLEFTAKIDQERNLWSDRVFMEKLNDFLIEENSYSQVEGFFIQCDAFLGK